MSDNWVVQNLENALETWNSKLSEIWQLLTTSPQQFKGGSIWSVMVNINGAVQAIGLALLVLFFVVGVGFNTPGIIKYPFMQMTAENPKAIYACINMNGAYAPDKIADRAICIDGDIGKVIENIICG